MNRILTHDYETFLKSKEELHKTFNATKFWETRHSWRLSNTQPLRYERQRKFIDEKFAPLLIGGGNLCDLACACGDFLFQVADKVKQADGYDISPQMIEKAIQQAKDDGIENVSFKAINALDIVFDKQYDNIMILGLFTCIFNDDDVLRILNKVSNALKDNGSMIVKDTLTLCDKDYYYYTAHSGYSAIYRAKDRYMQLLESAGFTVIATDILSADEHDEEDILKAQIISLGMIIKKKI